MTWPTVKLADLAIVTSGGGAPQDADAFGADGIPFVRAGSLLKLLEGQSEESLELVKQDVAATYKLRLYPAGTVLFAKSGMSATKGYVYQLKKPAYVVNHLAVLIPRSKVAGDYLRHVLRFKSPTCLIKDEAYPSIRLSEIENMEVPAPALDSERKRITAILDQADELRRKRQHAIDRLNHLGQAIFPEMFGGLLMSSDKTALLGEVCDVRDGTHDSPKYVDKGHPLLTSKNFSGGFIDYTGARMISTNDFININRRSRVDKGDIVMPMIGTIGSPVIVDCDPDFAIKNVALIKFKNSIMNAEFIRQVLDGPHFKSHVSRNGRGGTQKFVSLGDIRGFRIPVPSVELQAIYSERIQELRTGQARQAAAGTQADLLFASLQQRAFRGQL